MFRGTVIAQIIGILGSLYLAKLYGVDAYGVFGVFVSIVSIFSIINTLQLEKNIVTSKTIFSSKNWYRFLILSIPFVSSLLLFVLYILSENNLLKKIDHQIILWSFLGCIAVSYFTINESLFTFRKKFKILSNSRILLTIINVSIQVFLYTQYSLYGLIYGYVASQLIVVLFFYLKNIKFVGIPNFKLTQEELKSNNTIIKYLLPGNAINGFAIHLMPILLLTFFSETQAGVYFFTTKLLSAPLFLISSSVSQVYFQKASELYHSKKADILRLTKKIVRGNLVLMFIILLIINTLGIYLLELYLDSNWKDVRIFTLLLSFLILARTSFNPISSLIIILNKNHISLIFNIYLFLINLIAIYVGYINNDIILTIIILSLLGGIGYLVLLFYFFKVLKNLEDA
jgi:O-antigen/teichoic acid export membrane protein